MAGHDKNKLVFLLPRNNQELCAKLDQPLTTVSPTTRTRISCVHIEEVIAHLLADDQCAPATRTYAGKLAVKYLPAITEL